MSKGTLLKQKNYLSTAKLTYFIRVLAEDIFLSAAKTLNFNNVLAADKIVLISWKKKYGIAHRKNSGKENIVRGACFVLIRALSSLWQEKSRKNFLDPIGLPETAHF